MDGITNSMDMSLSKLWGIVKDRDAWRAVVQGAAKSRTRLSEQLGLVEKHLFQWVYFASGPLESWGPQAGHPKQREGLGEGPKAGLILRADSFSVPPPPPPHSQHGAWRAIGVIWMLGPRAGLEGPECVGGGLRPLEGEGRELPRPGLDTAGPQ